LQVIQEEGLHWALVLEWQLVLGLSIFKGVKALCLSLDHKTALLLLSLGMTTGLNLNHEDLNQ
jgi:hypothetical protein